MFWLLGSAVVASVLMLVWGVCGVAGEQSRQEERAARVQGNGR